MAMTMAVRMAPHWRSNDPGHELGDRSQRARRSIALVVGKDRRLVGECVWRALVSTGLPIVVHIGRVPTRACRPGVAVIDSTIIGARDGEAYANGVRMAGGRVIAISTGAAPCDAIGPIDLVLGPDAGLDELVGAIVGFHAVGIDEALTPVVDARFDDLSQRECAVLDALMCGWSPKEISARHHVALSTVRTQIRAVLAKLGVTSQVAAVALAHRSGWSPAAFHPVE